MAESAGILRTERGAAGVARRIGDAARVAALVSTAVLLATGSWEAAVRFAIVSAALLGVRALRVPPVFDAVFTIISVIATWANIGAWYAAVPQLDTVIHFIMVGSGSIVGFTGLAMAGGAPTRDGRLDHVRRWVIVLWVVLVGVGGAVLWEMYEWVVDQLVPSYRGVGYDDTIGDLTAGLLGAVTAGAVLAANLRRWRTRPSGPAAEGGDQPARRDPRG